jgi:hypothetical protein
MRNAYRFSGGKSKGARSLRIHKDTDLEEIGYDSAEWIHLAQDLDHWPGLMNTVIP